jgi:hypothetical protein
MSYGASTSDAYRPVGLYARWAAAARRTRSSRPLPIIGYLNATAPDGNCLPLRRSREPSPGSELAPWEQVLSE